MIAAHYKNRLSYANTTSAARGEYIIVQFKAKLIILICSRMTELTF